MNKILLLIPYFGRWPNFNNIYLESCKLNKDIIDIAFITDLSVIMDAPSNVKFIHLSFDQVKRLISETIKIEVPVDIKPYKLCDYRPAFGDVFKDYLVGYDFWGYGDNDLIYGDLSLFLTQDVLKVHDIIAFRSDHLHGPFTIYRNNSQINSLYTKSPYYKDIFSNSHYLSFDEFGQYGVHVALEQGGRLEDQLDDNITTIALKENKLKNIRLHLKSVSKEKISSKDIIEYKNGFVTDFHSKVDYSFYHWVIEKRALYFKYPTWYKVPEEYFISSTGFYTKSQFQFYTIINNYRKFIGISKWFGLRATNYIRRKFNKVVYIDTYPIPGYVKKI